MGFYEPVPSFLVTSQSTLLDGEADGPGGGA